MASFPGDLLHALAELQGKKSPHEDKVVSFIGLLLLHIAKIHVFNVSSLMDLPPVQSAAK